jgi:transcriptional regulator with XRE-family HTH domain
MDLEFIKKRRSELGISMQKMAEYLGFKNASTYLKYEKGVYNFKAEHLPILADVFKCEIQDFFTSNVANIATKLR